jgi:hypothetical protein
MFIIFYLLVTLLIIIIIYIYNIYFNIKYLKIILNLQFLFIKKFL